MNKWILLVLIGLSSCKSKADRITDSELTEARKAFNKQMGITFDGKTYHYAKSIEEMLAVLAKNEVKKDY